MLQLPLHNALVFPLRAKNSFSLLDNDGISYKIVSWCLAATNSSPRYLKCNSHSPREKKMLRITRHAECPVCISLFHSHIN